MDTKDKEKDRGGGREFRRNSISLKIVIKSVEW